MKVSIYATINKYAHEGYNVNVCLTSEEEWMITDEEIKLGETEVDDIDPTWLATNGLQKLAADRTELQRDYMQRMEKLKEYESKYLQLTFDKGEE